GEMFARC
ncbi:hypothetical protein AB1N83_011168, partial [Pleurotus pulmonarius]